MSLDPRLKSADPEAQDKQAGRRAAPVHRARHRQATQLAGMQHLGACLLCTMRAEVPAGGRWGGQS